MFSHLKDKFQAHKISSSPAAAAARAVPVSDLDAESSVFKPLLAATELADRTFNFFYSPSHHLFRTPYEEPFTNGPHRSYDLAVSAAATLALADTAARTARAEDRTDLELAVAALQRLIDEHKQDDHASHAWAVLALLRTVEIGPFERLTTTIGEILKQRLASFNALDAASEPRVVLLVGYAACRTWKQGIEVQISSKLAADCVAYAGKHFASEQEPIPVALQKEGQTAGNVGLLILLHFSYSQLIEAEDAADHAAAAVKLAKVALNTSSVLYDQTLAAEPMKFWKDTTDASQFLVEALVTLAQSKTVEPQLVLEIVPKIQRFAAYLRTQLFDPADRFYFRELRLYAIDKHRTRVFNKEFGANVEFTASALERNTSGKVLIKTLQGNAAVVRIFVKAAELGDSIIIPEPWTKQIVSDSMAHGEGNQRPVKRLDMD